MASLCNPLVDSKSSTAGPLYGHEGFPVEIIPIKFRKSKTYPRAHSLCFKCYVTSYQFRIRRIHRVGLWFRIRNPGIGTVTRMEKFDYRTQAGQSYGGNSETIIVSVL